MENLNENRHSETMALKLSLSVSLNPINQIKQPLKIFGLTFNGKSSSGRQANKKD